MIVQRFNQTASVVSFGAQPVGAPVAQTILALLYPIGTGGGGFGYVFTRVTTTGDGPRMIIHHNVGAPRLEFSGSSTGAAASPQRIGSDNSIVYGAWQHAATTWNGGIASSGIAAYVGLRGAPLAAIGFSSVVEGSGAGQAAAANPLRIGNRGDSIRAYNGDIAYVAQWNRVLSMHELHTAQRFGPFAIRGGLVFYWDGERDLSPYRRKPIQVRGVAQGFTIPQWYSSQGLAIRRLKVPSPPPTLHATRAQFDVGMSIKGWW